MPVDGNRLSAFQQLFTDQPIAYHPMIAKAVGSVTAGVLLSQLAYWSPRTDDPDGWIYKTQADLYNETGLTRREQETARRELRECGVLEEKKAGVPAKLYFRVNIPRLEGMLTTKDGGNVHPRMAESANQERRNPPDKNGAYEQPPLLETETTTETTAENTDRDTSKASTTSELNKYVTEVSKALGDLKHVRSNQTRATNLMDRYGLDEYTIIKLCQSVLQTVKPRRDQLDNPAAYFFEVLEERCKSTPKAQRSLAGRYWRMVQH